MKMQHEFTDPVVDCQEVQAGGTLFGTNTRMLGLKSCSEYQEQHSSESDSSLSDAILDS